LIVVEADIQLWHIRISYALGSITYLAQRTCNIGEKAASLIIRRRLIKWRWNENGFTNVVDTLLTLWTVSKRRITSNWFSHVNRGICHTTAIHAGQSVVSAVLVEVAHSSSNATWWIIALLDGSTPAV